MTRDPDEAPEVPARRAMLRRLALASGVLAAGPSLGRFGMARADDDGGDDGGDDGDDGDDGSSSSSGEGGRGGGRGNRSEPRAPRRAGARRNTPRPPPPPPELVVLVPFPQTLAPVLAAGYQVLAVAPNAALASTVARLSLPGGRTLAAAQAELAILLPGSLSDLNHLYVPDAFSCERGDCTAHAMIGWSGWPSAMTPRIGMIDTGINPDHPALKGQRLTVRQTGFETRPAAGAIHGTAIAAILIGTVEGRVPGLLPFAELIAVEAFHRGSAGETADAFALAGALDILLAEGVSVINMSFSGPENLVLKRMVEQVAAAGISMVAAAGNGGPGAEPAYPAAWPEVVAVTAVDSEGQPYRQANRGPYVDLAAPGVNLWTAASVSGGRLRSGTSYAAPFVTAAIAVERKRAPGLPAAEVLAGLFSCARDLGDAGFDPVYGHGLLSAPGQCEGGLFSVSGE